MTESGKSANAKKQESEHGRSCKLFAFLLVCFFTFLPACSAPPRNYDAVHAYYRYDFPRAREALRGDAMLRNDEQTILNNTRLGMAALADGDLHEAETALGRSFELLSTAGLNKDRTVAAVLSHEGVRIWKGEPFEQALTYHYVSAMYAVMGDWENMRAAAANSLFRLTDFGSDQTPEKMARKAASDDDYLERGYTAVDTNFALGFIMQGIGTDLSGGPGSADLFDAALEINPELGDVVETLRSRAYDTLLIVDHGKGPTKFAYGPDHALVRFQPQELTAAGGALTASRGTIELASAPRTCDVDEMAIDHRWNNLDDIRQAKSVIGDLLVFGGTAATFYGADQNEDAVALAGIGAIALGLLSKSGAHADTRYCELMPSSIYIVPLLLDEPTDVRIGIEGDPGSAVILDDVEPGSTSDPRAIYLRLHGRGSPNVEWLTRRNALYSNDHTGVMKGAEGYPWILGGRDLSTPNRKTLEAYHANGHLLDMTVSGLQALYDAEGILIGAGMESRPGELRNPSFRHVLEGGTGLFTPEPYSIGYKRLMCRGHAPYEPKSELARNAAAAVRVQLLQDRHDPSIIDEETDE